MRPITRIRVVLPISTVIPFKSFDLSEEGSFSDPFFSNSGAGNLPFVNFSGESSSAEFGFVNFDNGYNAMGQAEATALFQVQQLRMEQGGGLDDPLFGRDLIGGVGILIGKGLVILGIKFGSKFADDLGVDIGKKGPDLDSFIENAKIHLGDNFIIIKPEKGSGLIMNSQDGTKQIRFDLSDPHGMAPHVNSETFKPRNAFPGDRKSLE